MTSLDPTAGVPGDLLQDYHSTRVTLDIDQLSDYLSMVERFLTDTQNHPESKAGAIAALKVLRAVINGNTIYVDVRQPDYQRIARVMRIKANETLPKPILTTKKDATL